MTWPQCVAIVWLLFALFAGLRAEVVNREQSTGMATLGVFLRLAITGATVFVLHAGGFW